MIKYKKFKIGEIFDIHTGRDVIIGMTEKGDIPLISHQHDDNGITKYVKPLKNRRIFNHKSTIALADRGVFLATTQDKDFYIGTRVKALIFKDGEMDRNIRLFFVSSINKLQVLFEEYLNNATDKLPELQIMLPVDENDNINYKFMTECIEELEEKYIKRIADYLEKSKLDECELLVEEKKCIEKYNKNEIKYKEFKLSNLFEASNGNYDIQQKHINNKGVYVVSSGEQNNGIIGKSDVDAKIFDKNTITIDMFGYTYFRDFNYKLVTHARVFSLKYKDKKLTVEEGLFFTSQFSYLKKIFSYSNMASWEKIKDKSLFLPVTKEDDIDYNFINTFMKAQEKIVVQNFIKWKENR